MERAPRIEGLRLIARLGEGAWGDVISAERLPEGSCTALSSRPESSGMARSRTSPFWALPAAWPTD